MPLDANQPHQNGKNDQSRKKALLFLGIALLLGGILVRKMTDQSLTGLALILMGVGLKTYYIVDAARSGLYRPGPELWLLFVGLALFLGGLYLSRSGTPSFVDPLYLILTGLTLKALFVIRFIQLMRKARQTA